MRPLYLSIKGFGPYLKVELSEEIFNLIHKERLFLITGEIGAGKTTLFDAILFSLFGEASFPERSPKDLISHLLKNNPQIVPEVVFKFFFNGKIYQIVRRPTFGKYTSSISLWIDNTFYSQNSKEVAQKIKELFGLEANQFKKIFLIPQGEYREVILSEPKERKQLFEKLFDTEFLTRLEEFFKNNVKALREKLIFLETKEKEILALAEASSLEELDKKIEKLSLEISEGNKELFSIDLKLKSLEEEIKKLERTYELFSKYFQLKNELETLEIKKEEIKLLKEKVAKLKVLKENLYHYETVKKLWLQLRNKINQKKALKRELFELEEKILKMKKGFDQLKEREEEIEKLKETLFQKEEALKRFHRYQELLTALKEIQKKLQDVEKEKENLEIKERHIGEKLKNILEEKEALRGYLENQKKLSELKEKERDLKLYKERLEEYQKLFKERERIERKKEELKEKIEILEKKAIAVKLAETLKEGEACPVCGSKVHPCKAKKDLFLSSIEPLKKELEEVESHLEKVKNKVSQIEGELSLLKKRLPEDETLFYNNLKEFEETLKTFENISFLFNNIESYEIKERELNKNLEEILSKRKELEMEYINLKTKEGTLEGRNKGHKGFSFKRGKARRNRSAKGNLRIKKLSHRL